MDQTISFNPYKEKSQGSREDYEYPLKHLLLNKKKSVLYNNNLLQNEAIDSGEDAFNSNFFLKSEPSLDFKVFPSSNEQRNNNNVSVDWNSKLLKTPYCSVERREKNMNMPHSSYESRSESSDSYVNDNVTVKHETVDFSENISSFSANNVELSRPTSSQSSYLSVVSGDVPGTSTARDARLVQATGRRTFRPKPSIQSFSSNPNLIRLDEKASDEKWAHASHKTLRNFPCNC